MRFPRKKQKDDEAGPSPEDTQEMFTAGQSLPPDSDETLEYDEYEEWEEDETGVLDEEFDDELEVEPVDEAGENAEEVGETTERRDILAELKVWVKDTGTKAGAIWSRLLKRVGDTRLPRHEVDGQKVLAGAGIVAVALLVAAGGYLLGKGSGDDLDTARLEGEFAGRKAGAVAGATKGYAAGFKKGRDLAFRKSYSASYRRNYRRAYESAGMDPPKAGDIEVPEP